MSKNISFDERKENLTTELRPATDSSCKYIVSEFTTPALVQPVGKDKLDCDARAAASLYISKGYMPIPVEKWSKKPVGNQWQCKRLVEADIAGEFQGNKNIGLILGEPSGGLTDVDLDCEAAVRAGSILLPKTGMIHSRGSNDSRHFWYICDGALRLRRFQFDGKTLVEIRTGNGDPGYFTMVPPSVHPDSKLPLKWEGELNPLEIQYHILERAVEHVAVAALLSGFWRKGRHHLAVAFSGFLASGGIAEADAVRIIQAICFASGDEEQNDRLLAVKTTYSRHGRGETVKGASALVEILDEKVVKKLSEWLHVKTPMAGPNSPAVAAPVKSSSFQCTDMGNAERLVALYGNDIKYCVESSWFIWNGSRWEDNGDLQVQEYAKKTVQSIVAEAKTSDMEQNAKIARWYATSASRNRIESMVTLSKSDPKVRCRMKDFDQNVWLLNVKNGTIDIRTGEIRPHDPIELLTKLVDVAYDPTATCSEFLKFLQKVFNADEALIRYVQKFLGYCLSGDVSEQSFHIFHGHGANGKSVLVNTIMGIVGEDYSKQVSPESFMEKTSGSSGSANSDIARLRGTRFVSASESGAGNRLNEQFVKQITGGEPIVARELYQNPFQFVPQFKIVMSTNHKPVIHDPGHSIWRRIRVVPFNVTISESERVTDLAQRLLAEKEGILSWMIEGAKAYFAENGNPIPEAVDRATKEYKDEMDVMGEFLKDCVISQPGERVPGLKLYTAYKEWCESNGRSPLANANFAQRLIERGFHKKRSSAGVSWLDVELRSALADSEDDLCQVREELLAGIN